MLRSRLFGCLVLLSLVFVLGACAGGDDTVAEPATDPAPAASNVVSQPETVNTSASSGMDERVVAQPEPTATFVEPLAALVNGEPITLVEFQRERDRRAFGLEVEPATQAAFDLSVLDSMIDQMLIEQAAEREGLVVTDAEVDAELAIQEEIASANSMSLEEIVEMQLYTMDEYREVLHGMLLAQKVSQMVANVASTAPQVHSRHILVKEEAVALDLLAQLAAGADFAQLAAQYSLDSSTAPTGGDLDWVSRGDLLQPEVEAIIFSLQPGERTTAPVQSSLGYHIIEVLERDEARPLSQSALAEKKQQAFLAWLQNQRATAEVQRFIG